MRLSRDRDYQAVFANRLKKSRGPITVFARTNGLDHFRLGLSVGKRVGPAVARTRVKRMLREAFRLDQHGLPEQTFDLVVSVRPHPKATLDDYRGWLREAIGAIAREQAKRDRKREERDA